MYAEATAHNHEGYNMNNQEELKPLAVPVDTGCYLIGVGRTKMYELINKGCIQTITIGRRRLITYASLESLANGGA